MRRILVFLAMVIAGLGAVLLLADDPVGASSGPSAVTGEADRTTPALGVGATGGQRETRVRLGEVDFPVKRRVQVAPGQFEERVAYRVHVTEAIPDNEGRVLLTAPVITLLDLDTGEERGQLVADTGVVIGAGGGSGVTGLSLDAFAAEAFSLEGNVAGTLATDRGQAHMRCERLDSKGSVVTAPGVVTWWRDDMHLTGSGMTWDESRGQLDLASNAVLKLLPGGDAVPGTLNSPAGLTWSLSDSASGASRGELRGPVTGHTDDGGLLACERLLISGDDAAFTLVGGVQSAQVEQPGSWRARAQRLTVADDGSGQLTLVDATGRVHLEQLSPGRSGWLSTETLSQVIGVVVCPSATSFGLGGVSGSSADLTWDRGTGRMEASAEVLIEGQVGAFAGGLLASPGGMSLIAPPGAADLMTAALGELRGPVTGRLADGRQLSAARVQFHGPSSSVALMGGAALTAADGAALRGEQLVLMLDELGALSDVSGRGAVVWSGPRSATGSQFWMRSEALDVTGRVVSSGLPVTLEMDPFQLSGAGLRYDDKAGSLRVHGPVTLVSSGAPPLSVQGPGDLVWRLPVDRSLGAAAGSGELHGPVSGASTDGRRLSAELLQLDGGARRLSLLGAAKVERDGQRWLAGERLDLDLTPGARSVTSPGSVQFSAPTLSGSGTGLQHDEARGQVSFASDATVRFLDADGRQRFALACEGELDWTSPPDALDPFASGHGQAHDGVVAVDDAGSRFLTDHLLLEGSERRVSLLGPSSVDQVLPDGRFLLAADESIALQRGADGALHSLEARGNADARLDSAGQQVRAQAAQLLAELAAGSLVLDGPLLLERDLGGRTSSLSAPEGSRLVTLVDEQRALMSVTGSGRFTLSVGSFSAEADSIDWDVPGDHLVLDGDCRLLGPAGWSTGPRIELWPDRRRSYIPVPTVVVGGRP